jgi:hypothetical protein
MPGLGRRTFAPGEVLTATNVMGYLQDQAVMNFAGTAARGSAIGTAVSEGMVSYLADSNLIEVYNGSAWKQISGLTGNILQVVNAQSSTAITSASSTPVTIISASITPKSTTSKILVMLNIPLNTLRTGGSGNNYATGGITRNGSVIVENFAQVGVLNTSDVRGNITTIFLDSPSSTSLLTYAFLGNATFASSVVFMPNGTSGSITLLEVSG